MTIRLTSIVHILAMIPGAIALVLQALGDAPFAVNSAIPWALLVISGLCVYFANKLPSIFNPEVSAARAPSDSSSSVPLTNPPA